MDFGPEKSSLKQIRALINCSLLSGNDQRACVSFSKLLKVLESFCTGYAFFLPPFDKGKFKYFLVLLNLQMFRNHLGNFWAVIASIYQF